MIQYLQWRSAAQHFTCMSDPSWNELDSAKKFMAHVEAGRAKIDVRSYQVVRARD